MYLPNALRSSDMLQKTYTLKNHTGVVNRGLHGITELINLDTAMDKSTETNGKMIRISTPYQPCSQACSFQYKQLFI